MNERPRANITAPDLGGQIKDLTEQIIQLEASFNAEVEAEVERVKAEVREVRCQLKQRESASEGPAERPERYTTAELSVIRKKEKARLGAETEAGLDRIREAHDRASGARVQRYRGELERESRDDIFVVLGVFDSEVHDLHGRIADAVPTTSLYKLGRFELSLGDFYRNYDYHRSEFNRLKG